MTCVGDSKVNDLFNLGVGLYFSGVIKVEVELLKFHKATYISLRSNNLHFAVKIS